AVVCTARTPSTSPPAPYTTLFRSIVSDHVIFAGSGTAVLRHSYGIPGVIGEASFFTNPEEERRLRDSRWNRREAEAYVQALEDLDRKSTRLNSSHVKISYAVFCLK